MAFLAACAELDDLGGGRFRQTQHIAPVAYLSGGSWRQIVADWIDGDANFPHVVTAAQMTCYTAADGMRRICPTGEPARYLEVGPPYIKPAAKWTKVALGAPTRTTNRLTWTTAQADVNIYHGGHFLRLTILLKGGWVPPGNQVAFPVGMSGLTRTGANIYRDGVLVAVLRAPHVEDMANPEDKRPIAWDFVTVSGQPYILLTLPDLTGMAQPLIDPDVYQPAETAGIDTRIYGRSGAYTGYNYGVSTTMGCRSTLNGRPERSLIMFSYTIPGGQAVDAATLSLKFTGATSDAQTIGAHRALTQWYEGAQDGAAPGAADGSTWSQRNGNTGAALEWGSSTAGGLSGTDFAASPTTSVSVTTTDTVYDFDVTADVAAWYGGATNYGWWLFPTSDATDYPKSPYASGAVGPTDRPILSITYHALAAGMLLLRGEKHAHKMYNRGGKA